MSDFLSAVVISLVLTVGCSRQNSEVKPEDNSVNRISDSFRNQLMQFLSSASKLNAATETGASNDELRNSFSETKGQFDLLVGLWPTNFCQTAETDIQEGIKGWSYAASGQPGGNSINSDDHRVVQFYVQLAAYEKQNPFGIEFVHCHRYSPCDLIVLNDSEGEEYNNMPALLSIASKYFERGRQSILETIK